MAAEQQNALISVYDKTGIEEFGEGLVELGWSLYSSGGTAKRLGEAGVPVTDIKEVVGGEAILGHRVVTLSREVHAGLLADPNNPNHMAELAREGIPFIDLVCVDMYPLEEEIADPTSTPASVLEKTDIGGPAMLRSGAKGRRLALSHPAQRKPVLDWLNAGRPYEEQCRLLLAAAAEAAVAAYTELSSNYLEEQSRSAIAEQHAVMEIAAASSRV